MTTNTPESTSLKRRRVALIAHDHKKDDMVAFAQTHHAFLSQCDLLATGTTGGRLEKEVGLTVQRMLSGPWGGDLQIGAQLAEGRVDAVIFLRDPMTPQPHEPDINALVRACDVHNIPCATNLATADLVMSALRLVQPDPKEIHA
jgi:methylglyoxal synthase